MLDAIADTGTAQATKNEEVSMGKDDFLRLLVAQLENQNPLDPLDNAEFTAQLAQFSSLEQLFDMNKNMEGLQSLQSSLNDTQALNFLGREVEAAGNSFVYQGGEKEMNFSLDDGAKEVYLGIYDSVGDLVRNEPLGALSGGEHAYLWDGRDGNGSAMPDGRYSFDLAASGENGTVNTETFIAGRVDGVNYGAAGPVLSIGGVEIDSEDIIKIQ